MIDKYKNLKLLSHELKTENQDLRNQYETLMEIKVELKTQLESETERADLAEFAKLQDQYLTNMIKTQKTDA